MTCQVYFSQILPSVAAKAAQKFQWISALGGTAKCSRRCFGGSIDAHQTKCPSDQYTYPYWIYSTNHPKSPHTLPTIFVLSTTSATHPSIYSPLNRKVGFFLLLVFEFVPLSLPIRQVSASVWQKYHITLVKCHGSAFLWYRHIAHHNRKEKLYWCGSLLLLAIAFPFAIDGYIAAAADSVSLFRLYC